MPTQIILVLHYSPKEFSWQQFGFFALFTHSIGEKEKDFEELCFGIGILPSYIH